MSDRQGSLMNFKADCGHWMVVYSLEPTPEKCPDCTDKVTQALARSLKYWVDDLRSAVSAAEDCGCGDVDEWLRENGLDEVSEDVAQKLQFIGDRADEAARDLEQSYREICDVVASLPPKAERLTMEEAS